MYVVAFSASNPFYVQFLSNLPPQKNLLTMRTLKVGRTPEQQTLTASPDQRGHAVLLASSRLRFLQHCGRQTSNKSSDMWTPGSYTSLRKASPVSAA